MYIHWGEGQKKRWIPERRRVIYIWLFILYFWLFTLSFHKILSNGIFSSLSGHNNLGNVCHKEAMDYNLICLSYAEKWKTLFDFLERRVVFFKICSEI